MTTPLISAEKGWIKLSGAEHAGTRGYPGAQASYETAMAGSNNDLVIKARRAGDPGNDLSVQWGNLGGYSMPIQAYRGGVPARYTFNPGSGTDFLIVAQNGGTAGNNITVTINTTSTPSAALDIAVDGNDITVTLANGAGTAQIETATAAGTISGSGNATVVVTSAELTGSPITLSVAVTASDTAATWAGKVRDALNANAVITEKFTVGGSTTAISLTKKAAYVSANDATLNISLDNGTCTGITTAATSANSTAGVAPAVTTTAALLVAGINADTEAIQLVKAYLTEASSGVLAAVTETNLASGTDVTGLTYVALGTDASGAINSTGAELAAVLESEELDVTFADSNDGTGTVAALSATALSGGLDGYGFLEKISKVTDLQAVNERAGGQSRLTTKTLQPIITRGGNNRLLRSVTGQDASIYAATDVNLQKLHGPRSPYL